MRPAVEPTTELTPLYYSAGKLMAATQFSVPTIRRLLAERGIQPVFYQDDVDYYGARALLELQAILREQDR